MNRDISYTVRKIFCCEDSCTCYMNRRIENDSGINSFPSSVFMEIPINTSSFEIPLFAFRKFSDLMANVGQIESIDTIVAVLNTDNKVSRYKSADRYMRDILTERFTDSRLIRIDTALRGEPVTYYGTMGAVFDKNFNPMMICSLQMERLCVTDNEKCGYNYVIVRPILRINPLTVLNKDTLIEKYIVNKFLTACLQDPVTIPYYRNSKIVAASDAGWTVKVEIDEFPFHIQHADTPSISTTNQKLLQVADEYIEEGLF